MASGPAPSLLSALANPKSSIFTTPFGVILMFAGFKSRWMMPFSWAASSAIGKLPRDGERLAELDGAHGFGERVAFNQLENQADNAVAFFDAVDRGDIRMIQGCQETGFALQSGARTCVQRRRRRQTLDCHVAIEPEVVGQKHLAHPAGADKRSNLVLTERASDHRGRALHSQRAPGQFQRRRFQKT